MTRARFVLCLLLFGVLLCADPTADTTGPRQVGINVHVIGPEYRSPNQTVDIGYQADSQDFFGWIAGVQMYSDYTSFYLYDDWSGYGYWWTYHYTYDSDAVNVGPMDITYTADAWGYDAFGDWTSGHATRTVHPEAPYAWTFHLDGYQDLTPWIDSSFCPECYLYDGKWWVRLRYQAIDQWGADYTGPVSWDEDIDSNNPASGSNCGDNFSTGGGTSPDGIIIDSWKGCLSECQFDHFCTGTFWQGIFINGSYLGSNLAEFNCSFGYILYSPFIW